MSVFDSFTALDDLAQVIYQGSSKYVLLSSVEFDSLTPGWDLHIGLVDNGKWWRGRWEQKDVTAVTDNTKSETLLEAFAEKLASAIIQDEMRINADEDQLNISFGSSSNKAISMSLTAMSGEDTSLYLTKSFCALALSAQSRKCRLNPSSFSQISTLDSTHRASEPTRKNRKRSSSRSPSRLQSTSTREMSRNNDEVFRRISEKEKEKEDEINALKAQLVEARRAQAKAISKSQADDTSETVRRNPTKKVRRIQKMEFEDD